MRLYRPVGLRELELIAASGFTAFPPRLPDQPFFYPVLNLGYAEKIARDWNAKDAFSGNVGFVTELDVADAHAERYERRVVGASIHEELWVPADELPLFNANILPPIRVVRHFVGAAFEGDIDEATHLPTSLLGDGR